MNKYETLLSEYPEVDVEERHMINKGLYCDGYIWIKSDMTATEKACILAEELGHHETSMGNILDQRDYANAKQELAARGWAYHKLVPLSAIKDAYQKGHEVSYDMSEYLNVDEQFLKDSISYYTDK